MILLFFKKNTKNKNKNSPWNVGWVCSMENCLNNMEMVSHIRLLMKRKCLSEMDNFMLSPFARMITFEFSIMGAINPEFTA